MSQNGTDCFTWHNAIVTFLAKMLIPVLYVWSYIWNSSNAAWHICCP